MNKPLQDKVALITGASSGIGKATAIAFAEVGAIVCISARNMIKLEETAALIRNKGGECYCVQCDVSSEEDCKNFIGKSLAQYGRIDVLINNAGNSMRALFSVVDLTVLKELMNINFWGTVYCTKYAIAEIIRNHGTIAGISSIAGYKGLPGRTGYSASKFAMQGFLESLRIENLKKGIHVMIVCPGYTASNIRNAALDKDGQAQGESPLNEAKLMSPEQVARQIVKGVIMKKRTVILTMQGNMLVLLNKFFPAFMDRMVYRSVSKEIDSPFK